MERSEGSVTGLKVKLTRKKPKGLSASEWTKKISMDIF